MPAILVSTNVFEASKADWKIVEKGAFKGERASVELTVGRKNAL